MFGRARAIFGKIRQRLRNRPDTEHEQAILRPIVASALFAYLVPQALTDPQGLSDEDLTLIIAICTFLAISVAIFISVITSSRASPTRRMISITVDIATTTYFMSQTDMRGLPLAFAYLWITLANGFRFGPNYLLYSLAASVTGFGAVIWLNPFFGTHYTLAIGLVVGMIAVGLYVLSLVKRMFAALARAEAANQAKRRFISVVSHEMRTPLNAIIGMADLLNESELVDEQAEMVGAMTTASRGLLRLVEEVLDFSKIEAGRLAIEQTDFDLHALVNNTIRILRAQAMAKNLVLTVSIMPEVPHALQGDPHHLRQVLINLVSNAIKFTAEGSVVVHLSTIADDETRTRVKFSVRDTGIGIPPEAQARIFESFVQADQSTSRRYGGTGLGTTIAKQLVELMGGKIGLESAVGLGSTFWFEIEFLKRAAEAETEAEGMFAGASLLVAGFPAVDADALLAQLRGWGANPIAVGSVEAAVQHLIAASGPGGPLHSALIHAEHSEAARQMLAQMRRTVSNLPPLLLCLSAAAGKPAALAPEIALGFAAVLHMPLSRALLFNALHAVSAGDAQDAGPGVVQLRDYLQRRGQEGGLRILVADDSATNRQVVGKILERGGHSVTLVDDGEAALDASEGDNFDLIVLDRNMPGMDGVQTARALRTAGAGGPRKPIVILSADATQDAREECLTAGADLFLAKPIEATRLLEEVSRLCGARPVARPPAPATAPVQIAPAMLAVANAESLRLLEELGSQPAFLERLIATFATDHVELLAQMDRLSSRREYAELRRQLHAMKGSAASLGCERLADACGHAQRMSDDEMAQRVDLVASIRQEFDRARAALERHVEERRRTAG